HSPCRSVCRAGQGGSRMRFAAIAFSLLMGSGLAWISKPDADAGKEPGGSGQTPPACAVGPVLLVSEAKEPFRLRLDVDDDSQPLSVAWDRFLNCLFDWFDQDGDGALNQMEVNGIFPLPLPGGKDLAIDFAKLDTDGDRKVNRAALKAFCHKNGYSPV